MHPCPYHESPQSGAGEQATSSGEVAHADAGHSAHDAHAPAAHPGHPDDTHKHGAAAHPGGADPASAASHPAGHHEDGELCTHLGLCQPPSGAVIPDDVTAAFGWGTRSVAVSIAPANERPAASHPPYLLPYSLAPPTRG